MTVDAELHDHAAGSPRPPASLRIGLLLSGLPSTGAETVVVRSLTGIRALGVDPVLLTLNTQRDGALADEVRVVGVRRIDVDARRLFDPSAIRRLAMILRRERFDVVHAGDQDSIILAGLLCRIIGTPVVISRHVLVEPTDDLRERIRARLVLAVARWLCDHVIVVADAVGGALMARTSVPAERMTTVHNGVEPATYRDADRTGIRAELGWPHDRPVVLMVAWFRAGKGHDLLADIVPRVVARVPGVRFALVGDGELRPEIAHELAPHAGSVQFLGHRTDVPSLLAAADVMLLPSWSEALPTVLIEAGAAGVPVVASDVGGAREIVHDGATGHLVAPGRTEAFADRLVELLTDPPAARSMGRHGRARIAERFTVDRQAAATVAVYRRVARRARVRRRR